MNMTINPQALAANVPAAVGTSALQSRAMLASINIRGWSARKLDKQVTAETNQAHRASANAGRYNKSLIAKEALATIVTAANEARAFHYGVTMPWLDSGPRILPAALYLDFAKKIAEKKAAWESAVSTFCDNYPVYVDASRHSLGAMFKADDYPDVDKVRASFYFGVRIQPCPAGSDFRVDLSAVQLAELKADIEESNRAAVSAAMADVKARIVEYVGAMAERLTGEKEPGKPKIFRDSLVDNVRDLARVLPAFNLANDPTLSAIAARIESELCASDAEILRESPAVRESVADSAQSILDQVSAYMA